MDAYDPEYAPNHSDAAGRHIARDSGAILAQFWRKSGAILAQLWRNSLTAHPSPLQVPVLGAAGDG